MLNILPPSKNVRRFSMSKEVLHFETEWVPKETTSVVFHVTQTSPRVTQTSHSLMLSFILGEPWTNSACYRIQGDITQKTVYPTTMRISCRVMILQHHHDDPIHTERNNYCYARQARWEMWQQSFGNIVGTPTPRKKKILYSYHKLEWSLMCHKYRKYNVLKFHMD